MIESKLQFGVTTRGGAADAGEIARKLGEYPSIIQTFQDFSEPFDMTDIEATLSEGAEPVVTWEPWIMGKGTDQPEYSLRSITGGAHDEYIRSVADQLVAAGKPSISIRFAHEMNGYWYPWSEQTNGNRPGEYVEAWRHVVQIFRAEGISNVNWIWAPHAPSARVDSLTDLYPGSSFVGQVGLDGYNFGDLNSSKPWLAASQLFGRALSAVKSIAPDKEIIIAETGTVEGQDTQAKAAWITDAVRFFRTWNSGSTPRITAFLWFNYNKFEPAFDRKFDWRFDSSSESLNAMRNALRNLN